MPRIITDKCIKCKGCASVCPVQCIHEGAKQLYIDPAKCIDCGACQYECPVGAIYPHTDESSKAFAEANKEGVKNNPKA